MHELTISLFMYKRTPLLGGCFAAFDCPPAPTEPRCQLVINLMLMARYHLYCPSDIMPEGWCIDWWKLIREGMIQHYMIYSGFNIVGTAFWDLAVSALCAFIISTLQIVTLVSQGTRGSENLHLVERLPLQTNTVWILVLLLNYQ